MKRCVKEVKRGIAIFLSAALLTTGCGKPAETDSQPALSESRGGVEENNQAVKDTAREAGSEADLIEALRTKYNTGAIDYSGDSISIDRDESIEIHLGYNPYVDTITDLWGSFLLYQDAGLQYPVEASGYDWNEDTGILTIEPPMYGPAECFYMDEEYSTSPILEKNDEIGWGNLPQLYLATKVDVETGELLSGNPLVTVVKINSELKQAPQVKFSQDESGYARFSWKEVPGAEEYFLFIINVIDGALDGYLNVMAATTETEWKVAPSMSIDGTEVVTINDMFTKYQMETETEEDDNDDYPEYKEYLGVIAVSATGNSHISNLFDCSELAHMLPYGIEYDVNKEMNDISCAGTANLPTTMAIKMCDGSVSQRVIQYNRDNIEKNVEGSYYMIECRAYGTPFIDSFLVTDQDWDTMEQELEAVLERQEKLMNKGGNVEADISFLDGDENETPQEAPEMTETQETKTSEEITITANSALSEYLALQMLNGEPQIDISAFPESADTSLVVDAFMEAQYQNPLILGIKEVGMDTANSILYVGYDYDAQTTEEKRNELEEKAAQIINEIITDGMSELDKELAINQYLCDNAEYDDAALENASENDFLYVDEIYNDSFTAYGVLVNNVGVCASYSAAFKLLADAAELESVVVTGYLEGSLPHAWNKVKIDGEWNIVDSTNNDNEIIRNALFNLSDTAAYATLVEDDRFVLNDRIYDFEAPSDENEYFHIMGDYYSMNEITDVLVEKLHSEGRAMLRTEYDLDDETFNTIAQETANRAQADISGFHWMGVIYLEQR